MYIIFFLLILVIFIKLLSFMVISKMNNSFINSETMGFANFILIRIIPFMMSVNNYKSQIASLYLFVLILIVSSVMMFVGYAIGRRLQCAKIFLPPMKRGIWKYRYYLPICIFLMMLSFVILAERSLGLDQWLFNNRYAYIVGRAGNGIWYILFELFLIVSAIIVLCMIDNEKSKNRKMYFAIYMVLIFVSYFSGSKQMMLSMVVLFVMNYDFYIKQINFLKVIILGAVGLGAIVFLLWQQSGVSLIQYSDYYAQFLRFLNYDMGGHWKRTYGSIYFDDFFWKLIPRQIYPKKPYIYGTVRLVNIFFDSASIEAGNTPSLTEYSVPYADFGVFGVALSFMSNGMFHGYLEKHIRDKMRKEGACFNLMYIYTLLFFAAPINFSLIYIIIFAFFFYIVQLCSLKSFSMANKTSSGGII